MKNTQKPVPIILGAGLAGLSCAYRLATKGIKVIMLEKEPKVGGLAASYESNGLHYDYGPHRFHSQKKFIIDFLKDLMGDNLTVQKRKSKIYMNDRFFVYPLDTSNIFENMPKRILLKCFYDYILARIKNLISSQADDSFESWVVKRFGKTLYRIFFGTYTQKVLGAPPFQISQDWAKERITLLNLWSVVEETIFASKNPLRVHTNNFYYPRKGGIGQIAETLKERILGSGSQIFLDTKITSIKSAQKDAKKNIIQTITFEHNGKQREENVLQLMSTIPITSLPLLLESPYLRENGAVFEKIKFRSLIFAYLVLNMESFSDSQWIYLPEEKFFSNRLSEPKNFSKYDLPNDKTILCAEISCDYQDEKWNMDPEEIKKRVLEDIEQLGGKRVNKEDVRNYFCHKINHCYPVYWMNYKNNINAANELFSSFENLDCFGRNALFKYGNMEDVINMGFKAADKFVSKIQKIQGDYETKQ